jgi:hypothetical protein
MRRAPPQPRTLRVSIEWVPGSSPIAGNLTDSTGRATAFTGWLGLIAELNRAMADAPDAVEGVRDATRD